MANRFSAWPSNRSDDSAPAKPPPVWLIGLCLALGVVFLLPLSLAVEEGDTFGVVVNACLALGWPAIGVKHLRTRRRLLGADTP